MIKLEKSFKYALAGIRAAFKSEKNLKIHFLAVFLVTLLGVFFQIQLWEWVCCVFCFILVIGAELFNTALEAVVDIASPKYSELAKLAKDVAAGAVLVLAIGSFVIGCLLFVPKIMEVFL